MAISIPVSATADDRSFQRIRTQYERWGKDTGKSIGAALADGIDDPKIEKAFSKVGDAMSKVRAEEAKLQDLRERGASNSRIVQQAEALTRARNAETRATNDAIRAYDTMAGTTSRLSNVTATLSSTLAGTRFGALAADVSNLSSKFQAIGGTAGKVGLGIAGIGATAVVVTKQLYDLGSMWDSVADNITMATGKTGAELDGLMKVVSDVGSMTAASLEDIGQVVAKLSQNFPGLDVNGESIRVMASNLAYLAKNGQDVDIHQLGLAMRVFGVSAESGTKALDDFAGASRATGVPINELITEVRAGAPIFKQFGLDMGGASAYLAAFDSAGIDASTTMNGLRTALKNLANDPRGAEKALQDLIVQIKKLHDTGDENAARNLAIANFGTKGFAPMLDAIEQGTLDLDKLNKALDGTNTTLQEMQKQTDDGKEGWQQLTNTLKSTFKPVADFVFSQANDGLKLMTGHLTDIQGGFKTAADKAAELNDKLAELVHLQDQFKPDSPLGRMLAPAGAPGAPVPNAPNLGNTLGLPRDLTDFQGGFYPLPKDDKGSSSTKTNVPYDQYSVSAIPLGSFPGEQQLGLPGSKIEQHTGPGAYQVDPQKVFDAQTGVMSSQQRLEDARTKILELQQKNDATAQERQDAQNGLILAERNYLKSQQDLIDAQRGTWQKAEETTKNFAKSMDEFGTQLDKDFGLSKGLPGLAENLAKFIGSIAAAPLLGPLGAIAGAQGGIGKTGSGLIAMAGAAGAFGPQFQDFSGVGLPPGLSQVQPGAGGPGGVTGPGTPLVWNQPSASQPGFWTPSGSASSAGQALANGGRASVSGYMGDAALLSHLPKGGQYDNVTKDLSKGLIDCASGIEDLVNIIDGKPTAGGSLWTGNASKVLPQMGFLPGEGGPGDFRIGYRNGGAGGGHMQATLPDGTNVNFGSTEAIRAGGLDGSAGAFDPSFTDHYYRPVRPGGNTSGGAMPPLNTDPALTPMPPGIQQPGSSDTPPWAPGGSAQPGSFYNLPGYNFGGQPQLHDAGIGSGAKPIPPGTTVVQNNTGKNEWVARQDQLPKPAGIVSPALAGGTGGGPAPGPGNAIGQQGPTEIGGTEPKAQSGASEGGGGGVFGLGVQAASMAADSFAPGSGAAVQIAGQEIQRAIKAGGQFAGIATEGLMETFLPTGGSEIANDNWLTRIAGAFSGMGPQLPNMAGKAPTPIPQNQAPSQPMPFPDVPGAKDANQPTVVINNTLNSPNHPIDADHVQQLTDMQQKSYAAATPQMNGGR